MSSTPPLIRHVEDHLGLIDPAVGTWAWEDRYGSAIQAVAFADRPWQGAVTVCSLGVGCEVLLASRRPVRQEFLLVCWGNCLSDELAGLLAAVSQQVLGRRAALSPGEVLGPAGPLIEGSGLESLLCLRPRLHPESFAVCTDTNPPTELIWLVPVTPAEGREAGEGFAEELFARWVRDGVDLLDWYRA